MTKTPLVVRNGSAAPLSDIPKGKIGWLRSFILEHVAGGSHLASLFIFPDADGVKHLLAALTVPHEGENGGIALGMCEVTEDSISSMTPECPEANLFEREFAETWGVVPRGHPWLKPVRFTAPDALPAVTDFFRVEGDQVHEVAVGPVHAGVIEPGHFRFQCHGEKVMHLEIALGFQHRGIEKRLVGAPDRTTRHLMETAAGDTTCGHALAYAMNIEALAGLEVSEEAHRVRAIALELERIANHVGDLGALSGDVGFLPTASYCGRLRGDILNITALICGNRFGRGLTLPGGVGFGIDPDMTKTALERFDAAMRDIRGAIRLMFRKPSVVARFEETGAVSRLTADHLGMVGVAARASGLETDVRVDLPHGAYGANGTDGAEKWPLDLCSRGDVMGRARQREKEIETSAGFISQWLRRSCAAKPVPVWREYALKPDSVAVSLVEGWRGQVGHVAVTDASGRFAAYKIVDPSFHNWAGLAMALRGQQISDFPLCNKSFNLSYCGHDL